MEKVLGRGTLYIMVASAIFVVLSYLIHLMIARFLNPESYGLFGILMAVYLINTSIITSGLPRAVAKFISAEPQKSESIFNAALKSQLKLVGAMIIFYLLLAKPIAFFLKDENLVKGIIFTGIMTLPFAMVILYQNGYFNGLRRFKEQALSIIIHSILRVVFTILFVLLGFNVFGALWGYFAASVSVLVLILWIVKRINKSKVGLSNLEKNENQKILLSFAFPLIISAVVYNLTKNINVLFVKGFLGDNHLAGLYTAATTISNLPYMVLIGLSITLLPSISKSLAENNLLMTQRYITQSLRYLLIVLCPITVLMIAMPNALLGLFYPKEYSSAGIILGYLAVSSAFILLVSVFTTIITGSGKPKVEMFINIMMLVVLIILNIILIPLAGLKGAALASAISAGVALIISGMIIYRKFNVLIKPISVLRISASSVILYLIAHYWSPSSSLLWVGITIISSFLGYFLFLLITKEVKNEDLKIIKGWLSRGVV